MPSLWLRGFCDLGLSSPWYRVGDILTNGDFSYKCKFSLQKSNFYSDFRASPVSAIFQNNQLKIILMEKRHILG